MEDRHLVLIPGLLCTERLYADQMAALGGAGVAVSVADHTGADSMAGLAAAILGQAPERFTLAGLSMGGYIAFEIMRAAPERVERLALLDTSARPDAPEQSENRRRLVALAERKGVGVPAREMFAKLVAPARADDAELKAAFLEMAEATGVRAFANQQAAILGRADSRPLLAAITCPTLVLVGEPHPANTRTLRDLGGVAQVLTVPRFPELTPAALDEWAAGQDLDFLVPRVFRGAARS